MNAEQQVLVGKWIEEKWPVGGEGRKLRSKYEKKYIRAKEEYEKIEPTNDSYTFLRQKTVYVNNKNDYLKIDEEMEKELEEVVKKYDEKKKKAISQMKLSFEGMKREGQKKPKSYEVRERNYENSLKDFLPFESPIERDIRLSNTTEKNWYSKAEFQGEEEFLESLGSKNEKIFLHTQKISECVFSEKNILDGQNPENSKSSKTTEDISKTEKQSVTKDIKDSKESEILKDYLENGWKKPFTAEEAELSRERDKYGFKPTTLDKKGLLYSTAKNYKIDSFNPESEIDPSWNTKKTPTLPPSPFANYLPDSLSHMFSSNPERNGLVMKKKPRMITLSKTPYEELYKEPTAPLKEILLGE